MRIATPMQSRSHKTMQRFIAAASRLAEEKRWEAISIAELVTAANSSVGAFYSRFGSKEALLEVLDDAHVNALTNILTRCTAGEPKALETSVALLLRELVDYHLEHRGLLRTLVLTARSTSEDSYAENSARLNAHLEPVVAHLLACTDVPTGCRATHIATALTFCHSALREQILFPEAVPLKLTSKRKLHNSLRASFLGTLHALVSA